MSGTKVIRKSWQQICRVDSSKIRRSANKSEGHDMSRLTKAFVMDVAWSAYVVPTRRSNCARIQNV